MARSCTHGFPATASFSTVLSTCSSRHPWVAILCMSLRDSTGGRFFVPPVPRIPSKKSAAVYDRSPLVEKIQGNTFCLVHFNRIFLFVGVWDIKLFLKVFLSFWRPSQMDTAPRILFFAGNGICSEKTTSRGEHSYELENSVRFCLECCSPQKTTLFTCLLHPMHLKKSDSWLRFYDFLSFSYFFANSNENHDFKWVHHTNPYILLFTRSFNAKTYRTIQLEVYSN